MLLKKIFFADLQTLPKCSRLLYSLNILRGEIFAEFAVLGVTSENFTLEIF